MGKQRYKNPPVIEALCEVYFKDSQWDETIPGLFYSKIRDRFPKRRDKKSVHAQLKFEQTGNVDTSIRPGPGRMQFLSIDERRIVQVASDVLVVNQLPPYPNFEDWEPVIYETAEHYRELAKPASAVSIGVRYINRIEIPGPRVTLPDYFTVYPQVPDQVAEDHGGFLLRVDLSPAIADEEFLLTLASEPLPPPAPITFLLDLYAKIALPSETWQKELEPVVRRAQKKIEHGFEASITDRLRARFGEES